MVIDNASTSCIGVIQTLTPHTGYLQPDGSKTSCTGVIQTLTPHTWLHSTRWF